MNTTARLPILIGAGLLSAAIGAGPAQAAGVAHQGPQPPHGQSSDLIGYFDNRSDCQWVGRVGEMQNRWDDANCDDVNFGPYHGMWRLSADSGNVHDTGFPGDHNPGDHNPGDHNPGDHHPGGGGHGPHH